MKRKTIKRKNYRKNPLNEGVVRQIYHDKFDDEQYYKEIIDHAVQNKFRINVKSKDDKFYIIGVITKLKTHYSIEVKDKYGIAANVVFQLKDVLSLDLESATIILK